MTATADRATVRTDRTGFRAEVRALLAEERVRDQVTSVARLGPTAEVERLDVYGWLGERGLLAPHWPVGHGGRGLGPAEAAIVTEELTLAGVPDDVHVLSIDIVGTFLLRAGTDAQKRQHLPGLAAGTSLATVLFTEPSAGSDLAALRTRAVPDGDGWRLHGVKLYNQKSQFADVALCAARTSESPVQWHGISLFLVPLRTPGVHVETVPTMTNEQFTRVTLDGIRVGPEDVVGPVDAGWQQIGELLLLERTGIDFHGKVRRLLDLVLRRAAERGLLADPAYGPVLAELDAALRAAHALAWETVGNLEAGVSDPVLASMAKWYVSEQTRPVLDSALEVHGPDAVRSVWDPHPVDDGLLEAGFRAAPTHRLASGSSEVMLYLIATSGLGLL